MSPQDRGAGQSAKARRRLSVGGLLAAAAVLGLGLFFLLGASAITVLPNYARIGPRFFPYMVGGGLLVAGLFLLRQEIRSARGERRPHQTAAPVPEDWSAVAWITAGLVLHVGLMERAGYILATTILFVLAARGLGSRRYLTGAFAGLVLALASYLAFTRLLDLRLPSGWLGILLA